jgi:hypothetical protein
MKLTDYSGRRFGLLLVVERAPNRGRWVQWRCRCDCGTEKIADAALLRTGHTQSCGCLRREVATDRMLKHGHNRANKPSPTYHSWSAMIARCTNPKSSKYPDYGGRGIRVCDRWMEFANFLADMGERPPGMTLDREDNDDDYRPGNCRWTDATTQANNRRKRKCQKRS